MGSCRFQVALVCTRGAWTGTRVSWNGSHTLLWVGTLCSSTPPRGVHPYINQVDAPGKKISSQARQVRLCRDLFQARPAPEAVVCDGREES